MKKEVKMNIKTVFLGTTENQKKTSQLGLLFLAQVFLTLISGICSRLNWLDQVPSIVLIILSELIILIPALVYAFRQKLSAADLGLHRIKCGTVFMTLEMTLLLFPVTSFVNLLSQFFVPNTVVQLADALNKEMPSYVLFIYMGIVAPLVEEFAFRGIFANQLKKVSSPLKAVLLSALLFGIFHFNINQFLYAFVLGIAMAAVNITSGSVFTSTIIHLVFNSFNVAIILLTSNLQTDVSLAESAEAMRQSRGMLGTYVVFWGIAAMIALPFLRMCIRWIAKHEGNQEALAELSWKHKSEQNTSILRNIPLMAAIILGAIMLVVFEFLE